jgi:hypothetical protein
MIAECTRDISDEEVSDTEDPELMVCYRSSMYLRLSISVKSRHRLETMPIFAFWKIRLGVDEFKVVFC